MKCVRGYCFGPTLVLALLTGGLAPARADLIYMTFDPLPPDGREITSYTENGLTLFALDGPPEHFHAVLNMVNGTTGARVFGTDGSPQEFNFGGDPFDLVSIDFYGLLIGPVTFTSSSGETQTVTSQGVVEFSPGFQGITSVRMDIPSNGLVNMDDIAFRPVPEPSTFVLLAVGTVALAGARLRRRAA